jgi:hypothetical protein
LQDTRPTTGIISDMTHPVGVVSDVLGLNNLMWLNGQGNKGFLSQPAPDVVWSFDRHQASHGDIPVCFDASYGWDEQQRRVCVLYRHDNGQAYMQDYSFDSRDENGNVFDQMQVFGLNDIGDELHHVETLDTLGHGDNNKACNYMRTSLNAYDAHKAKSDQFFPITGFSHAMLLQNMLADMEAGVRTSDKDARLDALDAPAVLRDASYTPDISKIINRIGMEEVQRRMSATYPLDKGFDFHL